MLIETQYLSNSKKLLASYINHDGEVMTKYFNWETPFKYEICSPNDPARDPKYHSWEGKPIKKVDAAYPDRYSIYEFLDALPAEDTAEMFEFFLPKIYFIDIETEVVDGFPDPAEAPTMIQSISIVYDDKIILLGLKPLSDEAQKRIIDGTNEYFAKFGTQYKLKYIQYNTEFDMLYTFFNKMLPKMPCITGWNFLDFDFRFLVNRAKKLKLNRFGKVYTIDPKVSSITNKLNTIWGTDYEVPAHKLIFDYMLLYDSLDTKVKVKESKSLEFVSEQILGVGKIKYDGDLMSLYEEDFEKFMLYNAVDSVLVQQIHNKGKYIDIIFAIASLARIRAVDVYSYMNNALASLAITEGVLRGLFREENIILFKDKTKDNRGSAKIKGGWVKDPAVGMNRWVACYDFASLYPTTQRQFFISPENYKGVQDPNDKDFCISSDGYKIEIDKEKDVVCVNGSVFVKRKSATIKMLENVYAERKKNKKIMMSKNLEVDHLEKELEKLKNGF